MPTFKNSVLNPEFDNRLDRYVLGVRRVENDFTKLYELSASIPVMIDPLMEFDLQAWASKKSAVYINMAIADNYESIANALSDIGDNFVMDNIDSIPESPDKESLEELVLFILKREKDFSLPNGKIVDFSLGKCAMRTTGFPEYLEGKSINALRLRIPDPGKEMEYIQLYNVD